MTTKQKKEVAVPTTLTKLKLQDVRVIFFNAIDEGFGTSITIDATNSEVKEKIASWVKANAIGKNAGVPNFKEYSPDDSDEVTIQYSFKLTDFTKFIGLNGLSKEDIGFGAIIDLVASPFFYKNKFGEGISASLSAVLVKEKGKTGADSDLADLIAEYKETSEKEVIEPINAFGK